MLLTRVANIPICLEVGKGLIPKVRDILASHNLIFKRNILVSSEYLDEKYRERFKIPFDRKLFITDSDSKNVERLVKELGKADHGALVFAFGGGKVIDAAKCAVTQTGHNYLSVPTTLSNDGIYSPVAVITKKGRKQSLGANIPLGIVIDLELVSQAPEETIISGVGDLIAKVSALEDWKLAKKDGVEMVDDFAYTLAHLAVDNIFDLEFTDIKEYRFLGGLAYGLVIAGLAMELAESSRPCSGSEHMFSHAIDYLYPKKARPHGIQVAFGTLLMEQLRGHDTAALVTFFRKVGLPTAVKELDLPRKVVEEALLYAPKVRKRYTILNKKKLTPSSAERLLAQFS